MQAPNFMLLYVKDVALSGTFYTRLLNLEPVENAPVFKLFALDSGLRLGLKSRDSAEPVVRANAGAAELVFEVEDAATVDAAYRTWQERGLTILQAPIAAVFGRTFVACDPDGHRLRVFAPPA
jgi:catechol 2,3-dioxygenase-like lactoylglutathione lyase family enzyme